MTNIKMYREEKPLTLQTQDPKKVLLMLDRLGSGGIAQVVLNIAIGLDQSKYTPYVCTTRTRDLLNHGQILEDAGIPLIELSRNGSFSHEVWKPLLDLLPQIDILHSHGSTTNAWARLFGKYCRVPIIITHDHRAATEKGKIRYVDKLLGSLSNKIITVSEYDLDLTQKLEGHSPEKLICIPNGVNVSSFSASNLSLDRRKRIKESLSLYDEKFIFTIVGRLVPVKNHHLFFNALDILPPALKEKIHCLIVGDGPLRQELQSYAKHLGLENSVTFLGQRKDVPQLLSISDGLLITSKSECLPMSLLEGISAGLPVVGTHVGGIPEVVEPIGWPLVDPSDAHALMSAMIEVFEMDPLSKKKKISFGKKYVQNRYSLDSFISSIESLYDEMIELKFPDNK